MTKQNFLGKNEKAVADKLYKAAPWFDKNSTIKFGKPEVEIFCEDFLKNRLLNIKDVEYLTKIIDIVYKKSTHNPSQLSQINDDFVEMGTFVKYIDRNKKKFIDLDVMACVIREWRNLYKIFINENIEDEAYDIVDTHEKGHIIFNHTMGYQTFIDQFRKLLDQVWDVKIAKYFEKDAFKNSKDKIVKMLFHEFSNIAQDMEINSKLFDNGEWIPANKILLRSTMIISYKKLMDNFDKQSGLIKNEKMRDLENKEYAELVFKFQFILKNLRDRINGEEGDFQFCYPGNKGWPEKLDWMTYMMLLVKDFDNSMEQILKQIQNKLGQNGPPCKNGNGKRKGDQDSDDETDSDSDSDGEDEDSDDDGNGSGNKKISQDVLDDYMDKMKKDSDAKNSEQESMDDELDDEEEIIVNKLKRNAGGTGKGSGHAVNKVEFETCDTFANFTKFLRKKCLGKKNRKLNSDVLYNSNRGKFASRVVVPRRHLIEKWMPTECHIIVDVSGSVPTDYVERVINSIVDTNSGIDLKNSHIIFCDTSVVSDEIMSARTKSVYAGGGTQIANGIKYVAKKGYCSKKTDKLFIISDFEDNLEQWVAEAEKIPGVKYAIGYNVSSEAEGDKLFQGGYGRRNDSTFASKWNKLFKTVLITERI